MHPAQKRCRLRGGGIFPSIVEYQDLRRYNHARWRLSIDHFYVATYINFPNLDKVFLQCLENSLKIVPLSKPQRQCIECGS